MKVRVPDYYDTFKCIAGACTDTCCAGWQVDVDDNSYAYYKSITGEFGDRLHSVMIDGCKGAEGQFRIKADGRCPFLNECNLCDLYAELGEDALCVTCDQYPRYTTEYGNYKETGIALSCVTAAEIILRENRTPGFKEKEDESSFTINDIDANLYFALKKARDKAFDIVWDRGYSIWERAAVLCYFAVDIQKKIKRPTEIGQVIERYSKEYMDRALTALKGEKCSEKEVCPVYVSFFKQHLKLMIIKKEWPERIFSMLTNLFTYGYRRKSEEFSLYIKDYEYEFENILNYFIFRYFLKGVFDRDVLTKVKLAVIATLTIYQCQLGHFTDSHNRLSFNDRVWITHLFSREIEHSEENFAALCKGFSGKRIYSVKNIVKLLQYNDLIKK